jgi:hypothetical protein
LQTQIIRSLNNWSRRYAYLGLLAAGGIATCGGAEW